MLERVVDDEGERIEWRKFDPKKSTKVTAKDKLYGAICALTPKYVLDGGWIPIKEAEEKASIGSRHTTLRWVDELEKEKRIEYETSDGGSGGSMIRLANEVEDIDDGMHGEGLFDEDSKSGF